MRASTVAFLAMELSPKCPVCLSQAFSVLGHRVYSKTDRAGLDEYCRKRYSVLFGLWAPGQSRVRFESWLCNHCGFVLLAPRPTVDELQAKYEYLKEAGSSSEQCGYDPVVEGRRALVLYKKLARWLPQRESSILDFGGDDGRLMERFSKSGCHCFLTDYSESVSAFVEKIGCSLRDVPKGQKFDVVVCSHVVEHLADPGATLSGLAERLQPSGVLYVEVPFEVWREPPLPREPVTHVNFFTPDSLRYLMERCGFRCHYCRLSSSFHQSGQWLTTVDALGVPDPGATPTAFEGASSRTRRMLSPGLLMRLRVLKANPRSAVSRLRRLFDGYPGHSPFVGGVKA